MNRRNEKEIGREPTQNDISGSGKDRVYLDFYRLKEAPFSITPDPEFLFFSNTHQSVMDKVLYGINNRLGFTLLTGEVGTGKTTICRLILDRLDGTAEMVYIINPSLSGRELVSSILDDLGLDYPSGASKKDLIDHLNRFALSATQSRPVVIIIDDAQTMPVDALEDLRLLSNLETDKEKLLQMVLVGQPELIELISRPEIRQLRQRVVISCHLDFLTPQEVEGYIDRRLFIAGDKGQLRFTHKAKKQIAQASGGIPRLINKICDYALTSGYIANDFTIGPKHVKRALTELGALDFKKDPASTVKRDRSDAVHRRWVPYALSGFVVVFAALLSVYSLNFKKNPPPPAEIVQPTPDTRQPETNFTGLQPQDTTGEPAAPDSDSSPQAVQAKTLAADVVQAPAGTEGNPVEPAAVATGAIDNEFRSGSPYILQFGSFRTIDRTMVAFYEYKEKGIEVHWNQVDLGAKGIWYRLFTDRFETEKEALKFKQDHALDQAMVVFAPWTVLVANAASQTESDKMCSMLRDHRIDYYALKNTDGSYRLSAGAFVTKEGAAPLAQSIGALGYNTRVVLR